MTTALDFEIREAQPGDGAAIIDVIANGNLDTYPSESHGITRKDIELSLPDREDAAENSELYIEIGDDNIKQLVAEVDGKIVGVLNGIKGEDEPENYLHLLYVAKDFQRRGIGRALIDKADLWFDTEKPTSLEVVKHNKNAIGFYQSLGFVIDAASNDHSRPIGNGKELKQYRMIRPAL